MGADLKSDLEFGSLNQTKNALIRVKSWMSGIKICKSNPYIVMLSKMKYQKWFDYQALDYLGFSPIFQ